MIKKGILLAALSIMVMKVTAQETKFSGYIVDNRGKKQEGIIKAKDFSKSPKSIKFKVSENEKFQEYTIEQLSEFGVQFYNKPIKYVKAKTKLDESPVELDKISLQSKQPMWYKTSLFVEELVEGTASLYYVSDRGRDHYLVRNEKGEFVELQYRRCLTKEGEKLMTAEIAPFRSLLKLEFTACNSIEEARYETIVYDKENLIALFREYNLCRGDNLASYEEEKKFTQRVELLVGGVAEDFKIHASSRGSDFVEMVADNSYEIGAAYSVLFNRSNFRTAFDLAVTYRHTQSSGKSSESTTFSTSDMSYSLDQQVLTTAVAAKHKLASNPHMPFVSFGVLLDTYLKVDTELLIITDTFGKMNERSQKIIDEPARINMGGMIGIENTYDRFGYRVRAGYHSGFSKSLLPAIRSYSLSASLTYKLL